MIMHLPMSDTPKVRNLAALASAFRTRRKALGLSRENLAALAGCSVRFIHTLENGKPTLRLDKILDVGAVLGLELAAVVRPVPTTGPQ